MNFQAKNITTPTLILHGADDQVTKESSAELHSSISSSTLQVSGEVHFLFSFEINFFL